MTSTQSATIQSARRMENGRLVYYMMQADAAFWESYWEHNTIDRQMFEAARQHGTLPALMRLYRQYLPRDGKLLEAGCGTGSMVAVLQGMGFDAEGVDWAEKTVQLIKAADASMPVFVGDVLHLDVPDGHYAGYLSFGVIEHRREGPEPFLDEAFRVLRPGGIAMISVPYLNPIRALKGRIGLYRGEPGDLPFYQYALSRREHMHFLRKAGFEILDWSGYDGFKTFRDEVRGINRIFALPKIGWRLERYLKHADWVETRLGHMLMVVCRKPNTKL